MADERQVLGWRIRCSAKSWMFFADRQRADNFAEKKNATMQECYSDGSVQLLRYGDEDFSIPRA